MQIIHEAIVGPYKFTICKDWLAVTQDGKELVHLNAEEKGDIIPWLYQELGGHVEKVIALPAYPSVDMTVREAPRNAKVAEAVGKIVNPPDFSERRATQTSPVMVGNPDLAGQSADASADGKQRIFETGVVDLAALARKGAQFGS